ncbi:MAG: LTA synthase family protein [Paludibacteraceae bacterium]|nr:LTA synthase family protein [Paludibacteraceae bacterium]
MRKIWQHPWMVAVCNLVLVFLLYTLNRLFFYWVNIDLYPEVSFRHLLEMLIGGMRFDVTALFYLNSVYMLLMWLPLPWQWRTNAKYQSVAKWFYWVPNILGILVNSVDTVYIRFSARRTTMAFFTEFENDDNLASIFFTSMVQYWYVSLFTFALIAILILLTRKPKPTEYPLHTQRSTFHYYLIETLLLCISVYFVIIGIRSGFGAFTRPITLSNALQYTNRPNETNIVLNTPFCLMRSTESETYTRPSYMDEAAMQQIYTPVHPGVSAHPQQHKNIVIFIMESFSKEYIGYFNHDLDNATYQGYTPFLDSLIAYSTTYAHSFASGRKSIDAMPSVLASIPRIGSPYILTPYSTNNIMSLASCLNPMGYTTAFFHGAPNGSMGFSAFARTCGYQYYYGKDEYNNNADYDGYWAIWDEEFMQYYAQMMSTMAQPFLTTIFTATSHHPFQIPARYEGVFPQGTHAIHQTIGYSDHALRRFFAYAKTQSWYANTLFVITADHTNYVEHREYNTDKGGFEVPIIFFDPTQDTGNYIDTIPVSQVDIMPSILSYLGYDQPYMSFGEDVYVSPVAPKYVVNYNEPIYQCFSNHLLLQFDGENITHIYDYVQDRLLTCDLKDELESSAEVQHMLAYLQAYIQQYINRLMDNRFTISDGSESR